MKFYYRTILIDKLSPKSVEDFEKVKRLEKLLARYVLVRFMEEISDSELRRLKKHSFCNSSKLAESLKSKILNFDKKFRQYTSEFLKNYV